MITRNQVRNQTTVIDVGRSEQLIGQIEIATIPDLLDGLAHQRAVGRGPPGKRLVTASASISPLELVIMHGLSRLAGQILHRCRSS